VEENRIVWKLPDKTGKQTIGYVLEFQKENFNANKEKGNLSKRMISSCDDKYHSFAMV